MKTCIICKKKTDELYAYPEVDKVKYPICSIECFKRYLDLWSDEKNFPNNLTKKAKPINKKSIKRTFDYSDYEERGDKRGVKCNNRQDTSKKIQRLLRKKYNKQIWFNRNFDKGFFKGEKNMSTRTIPLEANTRYNIDTKLINLGWILDEKDKNCNVFKEQPKTYEEKKKLNGKFPDYVLYNNNGLPIAIIEAKKPNESLENAFKQAINRYALKLNVPLVFVCNDTFVQSIFIKDGQPLKIDGEELQDFIDQFTCERFIQENSSEIKSSIKDISISREELLLRFRKANDILREEGLRQGFERFTAMADILFLKLFDETEQSREKNGQKRLLPEKYAWSSFIKKNNPSEILDFINDSVWKNLKKIYPNLFNQEFLIKKSEVLEDIMNLLDFNLSSVDLDVKGDAFEFFLKNVTNGNKDLGEYYTPRHISRTMVKLLKPKFGEKIYDPFCGTGGFLIEAFKYLRLSIDLKSESNLNVIKRETLTGREITSTSRIAQMNLILFDDGESNISQMDSLKNPIKNKFNVVITNIPYSQKTKYGGLYDVPIKNNENADVICVQHAFDSLIDGGRGAIIVPETFLYKGGKTEEVRKKMIDNCSEFTVISLPRGVFNPYTPTKTDILLFKKRDGKEDKKIKNIFFYVIQNDGFELGGRRRPLKGSSDIKNLLGLDEYENNPPTSINVDIVNITTNNYNLRPFFYMEDKIKSNRKLVSLKILERDERIDPILDSEKEFKVCKVSQDGIFLDDIKTGEELNQKYKIVRAGDLVYNPHRINVGSIGMVPPHLDGAVVSPIYPVIKNNQDIPNLYILSILKREDYKRIINNYSLDSARFNLPLNELARIKVPDLSSDEINEILLKNKSVQNNEIKIYNEKESIIKFIEELCD